MSIGVIRGLLNCQMVEGGGKWKREREDKRRLQTQKEKEKKKKIELFSFPSVIQDVYYLLVCAAANFMPQRF